MPACSPGDGPRQAPACAAALADGAAVPLSVKVEERRQAPPRLHDLPSLQKLCASRFGWSAAHTLAVAQALYDGSGRRIITYPRAETRTLPESLIGQVPQIVASLAQRKGIKPPRGYTTSGAICRGVLDTHASRKAATAGDEPAAARQPGGRKRPGQGTTKAPAPAVKRAREATRRLVKAGAPTSAQS